VKPSYGLTDEQVEEMLIDALDHGEEDFEQRRLAEARVEGSRVLHATEKAVAADADLLDAAERSAIERCIEQLRAAVGDASAATASRIAALTQALDDATHSFAGRRMDRAFNAALAGRDVGALAERVQHARGVEAHLQEHDKGPS
jgi:molecular chaperone HscA